LKPDDRSRYKSLGCLNRDDRRFVTNPALTMTQSSPEGGDHEQNPRETGRRLGRALVSRGLHGHATEKSPAGATASRGGRVPLITTWSEGNADDGMAESILLDLAPLVRAHPWWRARGRLTLALLQRLGVVPPARVLDAGCGWGTTLETLEHRGYRVTGMDVSRRALERLNRPDRTLVVADLTRDLAVDRAAFDAVLALDVIEHIDDDQGAVARLGHLVGPGGALIVSVPALPELFGEFDRIQGHRRRYLPATLGAAFGRCGLAVESVFWWGQWLVPVLRRQRRRKRGNPGESPAQTYRRYLSVPPWPASTVLKLGFALEHKKALAGRLQTGTSLFAVARRPVQGIPEKTSAATEKRDGFGLETSLTK
jgi:2-polyprenyl-3-methyl-5-hydroxy-6-metoxy-1,4-benzoquinol methylase